MDLKFIGCIGDVHNESEKLEDTIRFLKKLNVETILSTGDIVDGLGDINKCCNLLRKNNVLCVMGNHERWFLKNEMRMLPNATMIDEITKENFEFLKDFPKIRAFKTKAGMLMLCHGVADNDMVKLLPNDIGYSLESNFELQYLLHSKEYKFILGGHTHRKMVKKIEDLTIINPGTLKNETISTFATVDFEKKEVQFYEINDNLEIKKDTCEYF